MTRWKMPCGKVVSIHDNQVSDEYIFSLGWEKFSGDKSAESPKPKRKRRTKAEIEADKAKEDGDSGAGSKADTE